MLCSLELATASPTLACLANGACGAAEGYRIYRAAHYINPNDDPKRLDLWSDGGDKDMLIVGHLPFMAKLVAHLVVEDEDKLITAYQPGCVVCLESVNDTRWQINWMIRPELLRE